MEFTLRTATQDTFPPLTGAGSGWPLRWACMGVSWVFSETGLTSEYGFSQSSPASSGHQHLPLHDLVPRERKACPPRHIPCPWLLPWTRGLKMPPSSLWPFSGPPHPEDLPADGGTISPCGDARLSPLSVRLVAWLIIQWFDAAGRVGFRVRDRPFDFLAV